MGTWAVTLGCHGQRDSRQDRQKRRHPQGRCRGERRRRRRGAAGFLPPDAVDPPLRGEGGTALWHGIDRRLLPPLHRPGGGGGRHAGGGAAERLRHHHLSRPRAYVGVRHGAERGDGGADRAARRLLEGQGRLDAHVQPRQELLRRPWHRRRQRAARHRARVRAEIPGRRWRGADLFRRRRGQSGPGLRGLQHGGAVAPAGALRGREQPVRDGDLGQALERPDPAVAARRQLRHPRRTGRWHGRPRGQEGRRRGDRAGARGQGTLHPRDDDLPLSRALDVGSGQVPLARRGAQRARRSRPDRERAPSPDRSRPGRRGGPQGDRQGGQGGWSRTPPSSPRTAPSRRPPSFSPTSPSWPKPRHVHPDPDAGAVADDDRGQLGALAQGRGRCRRGRRTDRRDRDRQGDDGARGGRGRGAGQDHGARRHRGRGRQSGARHAVGRRRGRQRTRRGRGRASRGQGGGPARTGGPGARDWCRRRPRGAGRHGDNDDDGARGAARCDGRGDAARSGRVP